MRILPAVLRFAGEPLELFSDRLEKVSAITHGHARSRMACVFYGLMVRQLLLGWQPQAALDSARAEFTGWYERSPEFATFRHILEDELASVPEGEIVSTGYVLHTLHASLWCLLTTDNYRDCALKAVNLGGDTDTTGCVAGRPGGSRLWIQIHSNGLDPPTGAQRRCGLPVPRVCRLVRRVDGEKGKLIWPRPLPPLICRIASMEYCSARRWGMRWGCRQREFRGGESSGCGMVSGGFVSCSAVAW